MTHFKYVPKKRVRVDSDDDRVMGKKRLDLEKGGY